MTDPFEKFAGEAMSRALSARAGMRMMNATKYDEANKDFKKWMACEDLAKLLIKLDCGGCLQRIIDKYVGKA